MAQPQKERLRALTSEERGELEQMRRADSLPASWVRHATAVLAVADGAAFTEAARAAGRKDGDAVGRLVRRFNAEGVAAVMPRHGGGPALVYGEAEKQRILREVQRTPDAETDGANTWSLSLLQRALRDAPDGLPHVSTWTLFQVLHGASYSFQATRTWCRTGTVQRKRKAGTVTVTDPETETKRGPSS
jgi:transposase